MADDGPDSHSRFAIGGVDFFITSTLSPRIRVLSESVLEILDDEIVFDLERIYIDFQLTDWATLRAGRVHTPIGYYTSAYHHAKLFQLTTARPTLHGFEDEGGILPLHLIGLQLMGELASGDALRFGYQLGVGNGRGQFSDDVLSVDDRDDWKAVLATFRVMPEALEDLEIGVSGYFDRIPDGFTDEAGNLIVPERLYELIVSAYIAYISYPIEAIAEAHYVHHEGKDSGTVSSLSGGFGQFGFSFLEDFTPYLRFEGITRDVADPFFTASGAPTDVLDLMAGLRIQLHEQANVRFEYGYDLENEIHRGTAQAAFGF